jgi:hypothetical protein
MAHNSQNIKVYINSLRALRERNTECTEKIKLQNSNFSYKNLVIIP